MNTREIMEALRLRYSPPEWAFLEQVANGTGMTAHRHADAVAMSIWPSRGLELHGHEVKASRNDWLKELQNPAKAEAVCQYCDRWWIVAGDKAIVKDGELPPTWGLIAPRGDALTVIVQAPALTPQPITKPFLGALLRRAAEWKPSKEELKKARDEGYAAGTKDQSRFTKLAEDKRDDVLKRIDAFEEKTGIAINSYMMERSAKELELLRNKKQTMQWLLDSATAVRNHSEQAKANMEQVLEMLKS